MIEKNESILKDFRGPGQCGWCARWCNHRQAAHLVAKGMGGGKRLDIRINLISLGCAFCCNCHGKSHNGERPMYCDLLAVVAAREQTTQDQIEREVAALLRAPKKARA